jgi:hypothetical protein
MLELRFRGLAPYHDATLGPAPWFRIAGNQIRQGPDASVVAQLERHQWALQERYFTRFECQGRAGLRFENAAGGSTGEFGPFSILYVVDGAVYGDERVIAKFAEETQLWHCFPTETYWPVLVIQSHS